MQSLQQAMGHRQSCSTPGEHGRRPWFPLTELEYFPFQGQMGQRIPNPLLVVSQTSGVRIKHQSSPFPPPPHRRTSGFSFSQVLGSLRAASERRQGLEQKMRNVKAGLRPPTQKNRGRAGESRTGSNSFLEGSQPSGSSAFWAFRV